MRSLVSAGAGNDDLSANLLQEPTPSRAGGHWAFTAHHMRPRHMPRTTLWLRCYVHYE